MQRRLKRVGYTLSICGLALILGGCGATKGIKPSQVTANQFMTQMQGKQAGAAYQLLSAKCRTVTTQQQMQNYWDLVEKNRGPVKTWNQVNVSFFSGTGGNSVTLTYNIQCANGQSSAQFMMVPEGDKWMIQGFSFKG